MAKWSDILVQKGIVGRDQLAEAARLPNMSLEDALMRQGYAGPEEITMAKAEELGYPYINLREVDIPAEVILTVPEAIARDKFCIPYGEEFGELKIAMAEPDYETIENLRFVLNKEIAAAIASKDSVLAMINEHYGSSGSSSAGGKGDTESVNSLLKEFGASALEEMDIDDTKKALLGSEGANEAPVIRLVNLLISDAVRTRASDIHIEPFADRVRVRYRIDGVCTERDSVPKKLHGAVLSRLKIMASIDIAEKRRPQDGRIKMMAGEKEVDLRVSVLPTNHGQSVVMRILDRDNIKVGLRDIGFAEEDYKRFGQLIRRPNGILLVTGPTGSGKTTTLYAALNELNTPNTKIITAEEPVEYYLPGVNQCEVKHKIGMTFAKIIRAMMRQNPNILLVGEIRDEETAQTAIQASLTGHLVFSTLHTNDAPSAITRLVDIGIAPFLVTSSVMGIMAQRLVRRICPKCKVRVDPPKHIVEGLRLKPEVLKRANFMEGKGCAHCNKKGTRGRMAIFELLVMSSKIREMAFKGESPMEIRAVARREGMRTLFEDGMIKAMKGLTTVDEVLKITNHDLFTSAVGGGGHGGH
ncbi:MAG: GspE/PulE family protein [bacterium]